MKVEVHFKGTLREFLDFTLSYGDLSRVEAKIEYRVGSGDGPRHLFITGLTDAGKIKKINAIKEIRQITGLGLKEAKKIVEDFAEYGSTHYMVIGVENVDDDFQCPKAEYVELEVSAP